MKNVCFLGRKLIMNAENDTNIIKLVVSCSKRKKPNLKKYIIIINNENLFISLLFHLCKQVFLWFLKSYTGYIYKCGKYSTEQENQALYRVRGNIYK